MKRYLILLAVLFSFLFVQTASANLVTNSGFETGDFAGWDVTRDIPAHTSINVLTIDGGHNPPYWTPHLGTHEAVFGDQYSPGDKIAQTINTVAGQSYTFSFYLRAFPEGGEWFEADWNGSAVLAGSFAANSNYISISQTSFTVTATASTTTIDFVGRGYCYSLDDVSVNAVPLPGTLMLLGSGLVGLAGLGRRKFRKS